MSSFLPYTWGQNYFPLPPLVNDSQRNIDRGGNGCKKYTILLFQNQTILDSCGTKGVKHSLLLLGQGNIYLPDLERFWGRKVNEVAASYLEKVEFRDWLE